jgi:hypothetical protein
MTQLLWTVTAAMNMGMQALYYMLTLIPSGVHHIYIYGSSIFFIWDRVSLYCPCWLQTHKPLVSTPWMLGLQACTTMHSLFLVFKGTSTLISLVATLLLYSSQQCIRVPFSLHHHQRPLFLLFVFLMTAILTEMRWISMSIFFCGSTGNWTQGLIFARQALYHLNHTPSTFLL